MLQTYRDPLTVMASWRALQATPVSESLIHLLHTDKTAEAVLLHVLKTAFPASFFAHLSPASTEASAETESGPKLA